MENLIKAAWFALILVHVTPAAVAFSPSLVQQLYGVSPSGDVGVLLIHRGVLFFAIVVACLFAIFDSGSRPLASAIVAISMIGFLIVYAFAGFPEGSLRKIAIVDAVALLPLAFVSYYAWCK